MVRKNRILDSDLVNLKGVCFTLHSGACYQSVPFYIAINIAIIFAKIAIIITCEMVEKKQNPGFGSSELERRMLHTNIKVLIKML